MGRVDKKTDRHIFQMVDNQTDWQKDGQAHFSNGGQSKGLTKRWTHNLLMVDKQMDRQTVGQTQFDNGEWTNGQTDNANFNIDHIFL